MTSPPRAWAEIDLSALDDNLDYARKACGLKLMAVVKAAAYGHGLEEVVCHLASHPHVAFFGVANAGEARKITASGTSVPRIYLLGPTWADEREEIVAQGWTPCLSTLEEARHFSALATAAGTRLKCHLAVDVGMGRGGFEPAELATARPLLETLPGIELEGIGAHLPGADEDPAATRRQCDRFAEIIAQLGGPGRFRWIHLGNSAGLLGYDLNPSNLARPGLMMYGYSPLPGHADRLRPAMALKSRVTLVRTLPAGHGISYGSTFITPRPTRVATIGIGYADGYPRHLSGQGAELIIRNRRFPLIGRVTMDQIMADVTGSDVAAGDEVELFGPRLPATEIAAKAGTIVWEILTGITSRVTRIHL